MARKYWLMKSEPGSYSIEDLARDGRTCWDGVRNYQARNFMRDEMSLGDEVLFYHSNCHPPAVVGRARVVRQGYPDTTALDPQDKHFDPKASVANPRWFMVDIEFVERFAHPVTLPELREMKALEEMVLLQRSRLSVQPVRPSEFRAIVGRGRRGP